jgi:hypothetical protein
MSAYKEENRKFLGIYGVSLNPGIATKLSRAVHFSTAGGMP